MKKYLKNLSWAQRLMILTAILAAGGYYYFSNGPFLFKKDAVIVKEQTTKDGETVINVEDTDRNKIAEEFPLNMTEKEVMNAIHSMSHQKVIADKKWGAIPLTTERVNRLIEAVEGNRSGYANSKLYLDILTRWANGDFSRVDSDHNAIWNLQGGTVGKATGIASPQEEKEFIEEKFHIKSEY